MTTLEPRPRAPEPGADPRIAFVLRLGREMHAHGNPAHRLEETLHRVADRLGLEAQFFSTPTSIFAAFGPQNQQQTFLMRVEPGGVQLERVAALDAIADAVADGSLDPQPALAQIEALTSAPPRYGPALTMLAFALSSSAAARFLGGGAREVAWAGAVGLAVGGLSLTFARLPAAGRLFEPLAAFCAAMLAGALAALTGPGQVFVATLAGIIVLIPGLTLTTAILELASRHLASGTARLSGAMVVFLQITVGVAVGDRLAAWLFGTLRHAEVHALPRWTEAVALLVAPASFTVLLRAAPTDLPWILLTGVLAFAGGRWGAAVLGPELGIVIGALTGGIASNIGQRFLKRPAAVMLVPAILLLVPGSIGFRSLAHLMDRDVVQGVETAFRAVIMFGGLAAGVLLANLVVPARRGAEPSM